MAEYRVPLFLRTSLATLARMYPETVQDWSMLGQYILELEEIISGIERLQSMVLYFWGSRSMWTMIGLRVSKRLLEYEIVGIKWIIKHRMEGGCQPTGCSEACFLGAQGAKITFSLSLQGVVEGYIADQFM